MVTAVAGQQKAGVSSLRGRISRPAISGPRTDMLFLYGGIVNFMAGANDCNNLVLRCGPLSRPCVIATSFGLHAPLYWHDACDLRKAVYGDVVPTLENHLP